MILKVKKDVVVFKQRFFFFVKWFTVVGIHTREAMFYHYKWKRGCFVAVLWTRDPISCRDQFCLEIEENSRGKKKAIILELTVRASKLTLQRTLQMKQRSPRS